MSVSTKIGLTVSRSLPSILGLLFNIFPLTIFFSNSLKELKTLPSSNSSKSELSSTILFLILPRASFRSDLLDIVKASVICSLYLFSTSE